jgi:hypothetical protein
MVARETTTEQNKIKVETIWLSCAHGRTDERRGRKRKTKKSAGDEAVLRRKPHQQKRPRDATIKRHTTKAREPQPDARTLSW